MPIPSGRDAVRHRAAPRTSVVRIVKVARYLAILSIAGMALTIYFAPAEKPVSFLLLLALLICFLICTAIVVVSAREKGRGG